MTQTDVREIRDRLSRQRIATRLSEIPDGQLACRAGRHKWALDELETGKPLPKGLTAIPVADSEQRRGVYQLRDVCNRCRKVRIVTTLPNGIYDVNADYAYHDPDDWVKLAAELDVTKRDLRAENVARNADRLFR